MKFLVVDDHPLVSEALGLVVRRLDAGAEVLQASRCEAALELAEREPAMAMVLLDMRLPGALSGVAAVRAWRSRFPAIPVVVVSAADERATMLAALAAGAAGFVPKSSSNEVIEGALRLVMGGGRYVPPELLAGPSTTSAFTGLGLTARQLDVLRLVARGKPNKVIGRELGLAERTVKAHLSAVFRALNVSTRTQAVIAAAELGLDPEV